MELKTRQQLHLIASLLLGIFAVWGFSRMVRRQHTVIVNQEVQAATKEMQDSPPGIARVEKYIQTLRAVNTDYAPAEVKEALSAYTNAWVTGLDDLKAGRYTGAEDKVIVQKRDTLIDALTRNSAYSPP